MKAGEPAGPVSNPCWRVLSTPPGRKLDGKVADRSALRHSAEDLQPCRFRRELVQKAIQAASTNNRQSPEPLIAKASPRSHRGRITTCETVEDQARKLRHTIRTFFD